MQTSKQPQDLQTKALRLFCHLSTVKDGIIVTTPKLVKNVRQNYKGKLCYIKSAIVKFFFFGAPFNPFKYTLYRIFSVFKYLFLIFFETFKLTAGPMP